jgi:osmoprotectant transport system ATP-binding protein
MIVLKQVSKTFGTLRAVDNVSLTFEAGHTSILLGSSGCGKSTLLRLILGLLAPDTGEIHVAGTMVNVATRATLVRTIGYVVQEGALYPHLTASRNVTLAAEVLKWPQERIVTHLRRLTEMVGLDHATLQRYPNELRRSLMLDPPVLLLDEPLGALDPLVRAELQGQLKTLFTSLHKTVILVTHDIREATIFGDTIILMTAGRIVQQGTFCSHERISIKHRKLYQYRLGTPAPIPWQVSAVRSENCGWSSVRYVLAPTSL